MDPEGTITPLAMRGLDAAAATERMQAAVAAVFHDEICSRISDYFEQIKDHWRICRPAKNVFQMRSSRGSRNAMRPIPLFSCGKHSKNFLMSFQVPMAQDEGLSEEESVQLQTFMGVAMGCGSLLFGLVVLSRSDQCLISRQYLLQAAMMGIGELNKRKRAFLNYGVTIFYGKLPVVSSFSTPAISHDTPVAKGCFIARGGGVRMYTFIQVRMWMGGKEKRGWKEEISVLWLHPAHLNGPPPPIAFARKEQYGCREGGRKGWGQKNFSDSSTNC